MFLKDITNIHDSPIRQVRSDSPSFLVITFPITFRPISRTRDSTDALRPVALPDSRSQPIPTTTNYTISTNCGVVDMRAMKSHSTLVNLRVPRLINRTHSI